MSDASDSTVIQPVDKKPHVASDGPSSSAIVQLPTHNSHAGRVVDPAYPFAYKVTNGQRLFELRSAVCGVLQVESSAASKRKLPGPLPHTMNRASLPTIANGYWVCEKTDGARTLLFVSPSHGSYLVDRSFDFFELDDSHGVFKTALSKEGPTLLDCELVRNVHGAPAPMVLQAAKETGPFLMCAFDAVMFNGLPLAAKPLLGRISHLGQARDAVAAELREAADRGAAVTLPFTLASKLFVPAYQMERVMGMFEAVDVRGDRHYCFNNKDKAIKTLNDGLIFTPNDNSYSMQQSPELPIYKWKWPGMNTVDFLLKRPWFDNKGELVLAMTAAEPFSGKPALVTARTTALSDGERQKLMADIGHAVSVVAECAFDAAAGRWKVKGYRWDKKEPNFSNTVFSCLEASVDQISLDVLRDELLKRKDAWKAAYDRYQQAVATLVPKS